METESISAKRFKKNKGVIYLKGNSSILDDEIEIVMFYQLNIIGIAANYGDDCHITRIESMLDNIVLLYSKQIESKSHS